MIGQKEKNEMKHVIALDVSKGKSTVAIYDGHRQCEFEGVLHHTRGDLKAKMLLNQRFCLSLFSLDG